ncbi:MAG: prepilin-type N-terminal cleavage/methylation domain-containing protein [Bacilli bacterium]|nr:prepilin-type N-terminal cleavage/methylation domain-containing protein [Bacilli bacterium]
MKFNKKGFSLIELSATIIIIGIVFIISSPVLINLIKDSGKITKERSVEGYISLVEMTITNKKINNEEIANSEYNVMSNGDLCSGEINNGVCDGKVLIIDSDGERPSGGIINLNNRGTVKTAVLCIDQLRLSYANGVGKYEDEDCTSY